jgi:hypothetical protein
LCIQAAYKAIPNIFNTLFQQLANNGYHPSICRTSTTPIIRKPNKTDYQNPKAYRPIPLLNCLRKIDEKIMPNRISYLAEQYEILHHQQMGGRRQNSAVDAVMALIYDIETSKRRKNITSALFIDVKGACDNVSKACLLQTMAKFGLPQEIINWTNNFMTDRFTKLSCDGQSDSLIAISTGIPQGSPVHPILFLIYLRPLFDIIKHHPNIECRTFKSGSHSRI